MLNIYDKSDGNFRSKIDLIKQQYDFTANNQGLYRCVVYCSILETIFTPEEGGELTYRLALRFAFLNNDYTLFSRIKDIYNKRSRMIHSGVNGFLVSDEIFLEEFIGKSIEGYMKNHKKYRKDDIDKIFFT